MSYWQGKVVAITGGGAGLGLRLATHFAQAGARLFLADIDAAALEQAQATLLPLGAPQVVGAVADITRQDSVDELFRALDDRYKQLDAFVNCAGRSGRGAVLDGRRGDPQGIRSQRGGYGAAMKRIFDIEHQ